MRPMRMMALCAGIGGFEYAAELVNESAGEQVYEIAGQVEIDPDCLRVLETRFPGVPRRWDIREVAGGEFG